MEIAVASKGEVTVRFVTVLVAIVCLLGVGAPLGSCSAANEGKLCCDEACSRKFPEDTDTKVMKSCAQFLIVAHHLELTSIHKFPEVQNQAPPQCGAGRSLLLRCPSFVLHQFQGLAGPGVLGIVHVVWRAV